MLKLPKLWSNWTVLCFMFSAVCVNADIFTRGLKRQNGVKLRECLSEVETGLGFIMCIQECQSRGDCESVGYNRRGLVCEFYLGSVARGDNDCLITMDPHFTYVDTNDALSFVRS